MLDQASNLIAFPLPPTTCYERPLIDRDSSQLTKPPLRSKSIPIHLRSIVVNLSALQHPIQQNPSSEFGISAYVLHHSNSTVESSHTTLVQDPRLSRCRTHTERRQDQDLAVPLDVMQGSEANFTSRSDGKTTRSKYPMTYKLPTNAELKQMGSAHDSNPRQIHVKTSSHQECVAEGKVKQRSHSSSNATGLPLMDKYHPRLLAMDLPASSISPSPSTGHQSAHVIPSNPNSATGSDFSSRPLAGTHSNLETDFSSLTMEPEIADPHELEILHTEQSRIKHFANSSLFKKPSTTDRHRPMTMGRSRSFVNRVAEFDYLPHVTPNNQHSDANQSPRTRSHSLPGRVAALDRLEYLIPNVQLPAVHESPSRLEDSHMIDPETPDASFEFISEGHGNEYISERRKLRSLRAERFSIASGRLSFFSLIARLDTDKSPLNLELELPGQKDGIETKASIVNESSEFNTLSIFNSQTRKLRKLKKSISTLKHHYEPPKDYGDTLDRLDGVMKESNRTLFRSPKHSKSYCYGSSQKTDSGIEKSAFDAQSADNELKKLEYKFRNMFNLRRSYHKLKSIFIMRSFDQQPSQQNKQKSDSAHEPPQTLFF